MKGKSKKPVRFNRSGMARLFRACANEKRIRIVQLMQSDIRGINEIAALTSYPYKTVERHLKILVAAGLVQQERRGKFFDFRLNDNPHHHLRRPVGIVLKIINRTQ